MAIPLPDEIEPWERQPRQVPQSFQAFALYRDQFVRRSAHKVAQELGKPDSLIHRWCGSLAVVRARAYAASGLAGSALVRPRRSSRKREPLRDDGRDRWSVRA
jgi:hypothetical protein